MSVKKKKLVITIDFMDWWNKEGSDLFMIWLKKRIEEVK